MRNSIIGRLNFRFQRNVWNLFGYFLGGRGGGICKSSFSYVCFVTDWLWAKWVILLAFDLVNRASIRSVASESRSLELKWFKLSKLALRLFKPACIPRPNSASLIKSICSLDIGLFERSGYHGGSSESRTFTDISFGLCLQHGQQLEQYDFTIQ